MGIKRIVDVTFWTDNNVVNLFSPEDRYFMLYLLTNPHTTQVGIYEINIKTTAFEMGWSADSVITLIDRFENKYGMIRYSKKTSEVAIKNFLRHSIMKGGKPVEDLLIKEISKVKDKSLLTFVWNHLSNFDNLNDTVSKIVNIYIINENNNDNDNDVSYHDSYHDSLDVPTKPIDCKKIPPNIEDEERFFEEIWKLYPLRKGKASIKQKKKKELYLLGYDVIKKCIDRYLKDNTNPMYYKHGSTFFNSGYIDYLDENYESIDIPLGNDETKISMAHSGKPNNNAIEEVWQ